jgi:hypothetical protein
MLGEQYAARIDEQLMCHHYARLNRLANIHQLIGHQFIQPTLSTTHSAHFTVVIVVVVVVGQLYGKGKYHQPE